MNEKNFLINYFNNLKRLISFKEDEILKLKTAKKILVETRKKKKKILIFGNGGSAAIASHFSVDLTKNAKIRCVNFNEADLLTCFSNDFGYEKWVEKAINFYGDKNDVVILISSSGKSQNMINGAKEARKKGIKKIITFTGNNKQNNLKKLGDINFWVDSKAYNHIENTHQILLLSLIDLIIGKSIYPAN
tara:strand:+ start:212 stop:781 length:570 start_codon:yes stop_codon:yes gene_type:complete